MAEGLRAWAARAVIQVAPCRRRRPRSRTGRPAARRGHGSGRRLDAGSRSAAGPDLGRRARPSLPGWCRGRPRRLAGDRARGSGGHPRPERVGQDDAGQAPRRPPPTGRRARAARRRPDRRSVRRRARPDGRLRLPEPRRPALRALGRARGRVRPAQPGHRARRHRGARDPEPRRGRARRASARRTRTTSTCRGASWSRWPGSSPWTRPSSCSTSRRPARMPTASSGSARSSRPSGAPAARSWR